MVELRKEGLCRFFSCWATLLILHLQIHKSLIWKKWNKQQWSKSMIILLVIFKYINHKCYNAISSIQIVGEIILNNFFSCLRALSNLCALASSFSLFSSITSFFNSLRRSLVSLAVEMMLLRTTFFTSASSATGISSVRSLISIY